ncbi:hypothetical protein, partial [Streptomyces sp. NPDC088350]|uniref:hypothetical protein n=1 Tax=Streptomyces sp. NPDC088350 TaxID=3365854 RepID=UPI0038041F8B
MAHLPQIPVQPESNDVNRRRPHLGASTLKTLLTLLAGWFRSFVRSGDPGAWVWLKALMPFGVTPEIPTPGRWMFRHPGEVIHGGKAKEFP